MSVSSDLGSLPIDSTASSNLYPPRESKWIYYVPLVGLGVFIYRSVKQSIVARKIKQMLNDLKWEDVKSHEIASQILNKIGKKSAYIKTEEFYLNTAQLLEHLKGKVHLLGKGNIIEAYQSAKRADVINEWFNKKNWGNSFNRKDVLKKLEKEATTVKSEQGLCPKYFYLREAHEKLQKGEENFAHYLRPIHFIENRRKAYDGIKDLNEFEVLKRYDMSWITLTGGTYEVETQIGNLFKKIRNTQHKLKGEPVKEKIAIITCSYGGGHKTAARAVESYVDSDTSIIDPSADVLLKIQWLHKIGKIFGRNWKNPDIFNYILKHQLYKLDNCKRKIVNTWYKIFKPDCFNGVISPSINRDSQHKKLLRQRFMREMPDQIVTVYHMALNPIIEVAQEMGIPVLHLATDYDCKANEVFSNKKKIPEYDHFKFSAPIDRRVVTDTLAPLQEKQKVVGGFPLRRDFFEKTDPKKIEKMRKERGLDNDTKVLLIMGGGGGQKVPFPYQLAKLEKYEGKLHVIVIAGANRKFGEEIEALKAKNPNITFEVARGDNQDKPFFVNGKLINELMDFSDVIITKSGGASTAEALQKGLPILFDHRKELFPWEETNVLFVKSLGRGRSIKTVKSFMGELNEAFNMSKENLQIANASVNIPKILKDLREKAVNDKPFNKRRKQYER